jgi:hypothetical protein
LLLFASAWVADQWPEFTIPALVLAAVVVFGDAVLFAVLARQAASKDGASQGVQDEKREISDVVFEEPEERRHADVVAAWFSSTINEQHLIALTSVEQRRAMVEQRRAIYRWHLHYALRQSRASRAWTLAALSEETFRALDKAQLQLWLARELFEPRRIISPELEKWKVVTHSKDAFNIVAGAFEIEHFHGRTNIRVLDASRVTVEGTKRGEKPKGVLPDIRPAIYQ